MRFLIFLFFLNLSFNSIYAQHQFDLIIPTSQNQIEAIGHPAIETQNFVYTFTKTSFRDSFTEYKTLSKIDRNGKLISLTTFLDSINLITIRDVTKSGSYFYLCGDQIIYADTAFSMFYAKVDQNMDTIWTKRIKTIYNRPVINKIIQLKNGNLAMVGHNTHVRPSGSAYNDKKNAVFILADSNGQVLHYENVPKPDLNTLEEFYCLSQTKDGSIYAVGDHTTNTLDQDFWIQKYDEDGNLLWRKDYASPVFVEAF